MKTYPNTPYVRYTDQEIYLQPGLRHLRALCDVLRVIRNYDKGLPQGCNASVESIAKKAVMTCGQVRGHLARAKKMNLWVALGYGKSGDAHRRLTLQPVDLEEASPVVEFTLENGCRGRRKLKKNEQRAEVISMLTGVQTPAHPGVHESVYEVNDQYPIIPSEGVIESDVATAKIMLYR